MVKNAVWQRYRYHLLFLGVLLVQCYFYRYFALLNELPCSIHVWRQSDCLSFVMNYYENGMNPFRPQVHHVLGGNGYTAAEFPGVYYLVAGIYQLLGPHEWVYRLSWMLILAAGLFCFYKTLRLYLKDVFWAITLPALLFCSPVLAFYGNSFIIDPVALSVTLMAWYFYARFHYFKKKKWLRLSIATFLLAGLLKEPALITYVALIAMLIVNWMVEWRKSGKLPAIRIGRILLFFIPFLGVTAWFLIKQHYNTFHSNVAFLATIRPMWALSIEDIREIGRHIAVSWKEDYFGQLTLKLTGAVLVINLFYFKKNWALNFFSLLVFLGAASFVILFYAQLRNHDYYIINILLVIPVTWLTFVKNMEKWLIERKSPAFWVKSVFAIILFLNILYVSERQALRYEMAMTWMDPNLEKIHQMKEADDYLTSLGIGRRDRIVSMPDPTMNLSLYLYDRPGWTNVYNPYPTVENMHYYISAGAKYLVINHPNELKKDYVQPFLDGIIGEYKGITVIRFPEKP